VRAKTKLISDVVHSLKIQAGEGCEGFDTSTRAAPAKRSPVKAGNAGLEETKGVIHWLDHYS
jgi:hypothetical protein